jgi:hypothetical protein
MKKPKISIEEQMYAAGIWERPGTHKEDKPEHYGVVSVSPWNVAFRAGMFTTMTLQEAIKTAIDLGQAQDTIFPKPGERSSKMGK